MKKVIMGNKSQAQKDKINDRILKTRVGQMTPVSKSKALSKMKAK